MGGVSPFERHMKSNDTDIGRKFDFTQIANSFDNAVILIDAHGTVLFCNDASRELNNIFYTPIQNKASIFNIFPIVERAQFRFLLETAVTLGKQQATEIDFIHPNGYPVFIRIYFLPILKDNGSIDQVCLTIRDVTSQKSIRKKNEDTVRALAALIENVKMVIFEVDSQGHLTKWNKEATSLTGYEKDKVLTKHIKMFFLKEDRKKLLDAFKNVLKGIDNDGLMIKMKNEAIGTSTLLFTITPKLNTKGVAIGATFIGQDITELTEYRASLEKLVEDRTLKLKAALEKEKELVALRNKFVSIASHEFKIPLATISALATSLQKHKKKTPEELEKLQCIEQQVGYMKSMLEDVLSMGKVQRHKIEPDIKQVDIVAFLEKICNEVMMATQLTNTIIQEFPKAAVLVQSDEKLLRNIFINLLSNAVKFSTPGNDVYCMLRQEEEMVCIAIKDFGMGINAKELEGIFQPFQRGSNVQHIPGTGLGLSIVKKAVDALSGELMVDSKVGETVFTVRLKVKA